MPAPPSNAASRERAEDLARCIWSDRPDTAPAFTGRHSGPRGWIYDDPRLQALLEMTSDDDAAALAEAGRVA